MHSKFQAARIGLGAGGGRDEIYLFPLFMHGGNTSPPSYLGQGGWGKRSISMPPSIYLAILVVRYVAGKIK